MGIQSEEETQIPSHKSGVLNDPNPTRVSCPSFTTLKLTRLLLSPLQATGKYEKGDIVNMSLVESGIRYKGTFTVRKARLHSSGGYVEYSLYDSNKELYLKGTYIRENKLTLERRRR